MGACSAAQLGWGPRRIGQPATPPSRVPHWPVGGPPRPTGERHVDRLMICGGPTMGDLPPGNYPDCFSASTTLAGLLWGYHDALASLGLTTSNNDTLGDRVSLFLPRKLQINVKIIFRCTTSNEDLLLRSGTSGGSWHCIGCW